MPTPSHPWKQTLEHQAKALQELMKPHRLSDATLVRLEETVVLGCYTIRRLINGFLLPDSQRNQPVCMSAFRDGNTAHPCWAMIRYGSGTTWMPVDQFNMTPCFFAIKCCRIAFSSLG